MTTQQHSDFKPYGATDCQLVKSKLSPAFCFTWTTSTGRLAACGFASLKFKPANAAFHYSFKTGQRRAEYVAQFLRSQDAHVTAVNARRTERKAAGRGMDVGDVLRSSWGYDQTNIDFYEVVALKGTTQVVVRKLAQETTVTGFEQGECVPVKGSYTGPEQVFVAKSGAVRIASYASAYRIEPVKVGGVAVGYSASHWTAYA